MALIDCPECTHKVSDRAAQCPSCGFPLKEGRERPRLEFPLLDPLAELAAVAEELAAAVHRTLRRETEPEERRERKKPSPSGEKKKSGEAGQKKS
ncbi:MAG: hypothetical protein IH614_10940 [Desulfuromonadales bacterium]|nr:hypothetical protein [Desulfuromonadales bacterium]